MNGAVSLLSTSTVWAFADRIRRGLAAGLYAVTLLALIGAAVTNNVLAWTETLDHAFRNVGGHVPAWPLLDPSIGVLMVLPCVPLYCVAGLLNIRHRLWPVVALSVSVFIPFLIVAVLALLFWDSQRPGRKTRIGRLRR
ncbi:hypothetical protein [Azospirillum argentinense]|uniref:hypothetical protein n=1 Tax=Azospirillum argentinense TaxID=2970906 RepID=UPI0032DFE58A